LYCPPNVTTIIITTSREEAGELRMHPYTNLMARDNLKGLGVGWTIILK
jgi:hypothetical protein